MHVWQDVSLLTTSHKDSMDDISTATKHVLFEFGCGTPLEKTNWMLEILFFQQSDNAIQGSFVKPEKRQEFI